MKFFPVLMFILFGLTSCKTIVVPPSYACETVDAHTIRLSGPINKKLAGCAQTLLTDEIETVIVSSFGGDTKAGRAIGERIGARDRTVIIRGECLSSCGNYFVPSAHKLIIEPGGFIGLHGTPDPYTMIKQGLDLERFSEEFDGESAFAKRFGVAKGWRLYRDADHEGGVLTGDMQGKVRPFYHKKSKILLIAERPFIESCLPHVEIVEESLTETVFGSSKIMKRVKALGGIGTGSFICKSGTGQKTRSAM